MTRAKRSHRNARPSLRQSRGRQSGIERWDSNKVICGVDSEGRATVNGVPVHRMGLELRTANDGYDKQFHRKSPTYEVEPCLDSAEVIA